MLKKIKESNYYHIFNKSLHCKTTPCKLPGTVDHVAWSVVPGPDKIILFVYILHRKIFCNAERFFLLLTI